jgi:hypothetical protein
MEEGKTAMPNLKKNSGGGVTEVEPKAKALPRRRTSVVEEENFEQGES